MKCKAIVTLAITLFFCAFSYSQIKDKNSGIFTDLRDGQEYKWLKIGNQIWMAENLNFKIKGSWWYKNDEENGHKYGRLYTWEAAVKACPEGWHLPSEQEWKQLE